MKVFLAVDVRGGKVVWGKGGNRNSYVPIENVSKVAKRSRLREFFEEVKAKRVYVADLDRIEGRGSNLEEIDEVTKSIEAIVDGGFRSVKEAERFSFKPIFATETFDVRQLEGVEVKGLVSVDVKGTLLDASSSFSSLEELLEFINTLRVEAVIVLPIHSVGTYSFDFRLLERSMSVLDHPVITGGGVRPEDLDKLKEMGVYGVIVGTAFHDGRIDPEVIARGEV